MPTATLNNLCASIASRRDALIEDLDAFVAIPTGHNHTAGLDEFRAIVTSRLEALGATTESVAGDTKPDWLRDGAAPTHVPDTAVCRRQRPGKPRILLASHLDTVFPPGGQFNRLEIAPDGKTAVGPGVVDMKGGIIVALTALEALDEAGIDVSWTYALNSDEETGTFHSRRALEEEAKRHDVGIATEPALPDGSLAVERKGAAQFQIETRGKSAHAGRDFDKGVSAVYALAHALTRVEALCDLDRGVTLNIGPLRGGVATNVVPDAAIAWGNARFPDQDAANQLQRALEALATPEDALPRVIVRHAFNRPAKPLIPQVRALAQTARDTAEALGQQLPFASTGGVCDGNILQNAGLPTLDTLGVRGGGLHTTSEWIDLSSLVERSQLLACFLARLSEQPTLAPPTDQPR